MDTKCEERGCLGPRRGGQGQVEKGNGLRMEGEDSMLLVNGENNTKGPLASQFLGSMLEVVGKEEEDI